MKKFLIGSLIAFSISPFLNLHAVHSERELEVLIESGKLHFNNGNLSQALTTFNKAMGYLREKPKNTVYLRAVLQYFFPRKQAPDLFMVIEFSEHFRAFLQTISVLINCRQLYKEKSWT